MILSRKQRLAALEQESSRLTMRHKATLVVYAMPTISPEQEAALEAAKASGRAILIIRGRPFVPDPPSLLTEIVEFGEADGAPSPKPVYTREQMRKNVWGE